MSETLSSPEFNLEGGARKCVIGKSHFGGCDTGGGSGKEGEQMADAVRWPPAFEWYSPDRDSPRAYLRLRVLCARPKTRASALSDSPWVRPRLTVSRSSALKCV